MSVGFHLSAYVTQLQQHLFRQNDELDAEAEILRARRRWAPRPVDEVCSPARPTGLPLVGASTRRLPAKLPALPQKLPETERPVFGLPETCQANDIEVTAAVSRWLEGGQTSALRLISSLAVLKDLKGADTCLKKPKIAFSMLKLLDLAFPEPR
eukprot:Skav218239  [mRNA]  locus=scaffold4566:187042:192482:+ [translate_table: standard]